VLNTLPTLVPNGFVYLRAQVRIQVLGPVGRPAWGTAASLAGVCLAGDADLLASPWPLPSVNCIDDASQVATY